jgi:hypothetical protein
MPSLAQSGDTAKTRECSTSGPGTIPTPQPKPLPIKVRLQPGRQSTVHGGSYNLPLQASRSVSGLTVELQKDHKLIGKRAVSHLGVDGQTITLRPRRGKATAGRYTVVVRHGTKQLSSLTVGIKTA